MIFLPFFQFKLKCPAFPLDVSPVIRSLDSMNRDTINYWPKVIAKRLF